MKCYECILGLTETVVGNGQTESPYLRLVRCPFEVEYYKYPDDECSHKKERAEATRKEQKK